MRSPTTCQSQKCQSKAASTIPFPDYKTLIGYRKWIQSQNFSASFNPSCNTKRLPNFGVDIEIMVRHRKCKGALFSTAINNIKPGDSIFYNMTRTGDDSWVVIGTVKSTGESTTQTCQNARLKSQPWAYNTVECYGCDGWAYPSNFVEFTENKIYKGDQLLPLKGSLWKINPKPAKKLMCHEKLLWRTTLTRQCILISSRQVWLGICEKLKQYNPRLLTSAPWLTVDSWGFEESCVLLPK